MTRQPLATLLVALFVANTALAAEPPLRVNGVTIPAARFDAALKAATASGTQDTPLLRTALRTELVTQEVLRQAALKKGYDKDPAVVAQRDQVMIRRYLADAVQPAPVRDEEVRRRYDAIVASLGDKEYKISLIAVPTPGEAREILDRLGSGGSFADLARRHSRLPSAAQGGAQDWLSFKVPAVEGQTGGLPLPLAAAVAALPPGAASAEPIALDGHFYLVRVDDSRPTRIPPYADAAPALRQALEAMAREQATGALVARLLKEARLTP